MKTAVAFFAVGLIGVLMQDVSSADPPTNAAKKPYYYTEGGRNDPFVDFVSRFWSFKDALDKYNSASNEAERREDILEVKAGASSLSNLPPTFTAFFVKSNLPPKALAISKPLFDALKDEKFQKEFKTLVPYTGQDHLQNSWFEKMDIDHLRNLYALYAALPFPTSKQLGEYVHADSGRVYLVMAELPGKVFVRTS